MKSAGTTPTDATMLPEEPPGGVTAGVDWARDDDAVSVVNDRSRELDRCNVMLDVGHRFRTAGYDQPGGAGGDLPGGIQHSLQPRSAATVDLGSRHASAQPRVQCGDPPDGRRFTIGVAVAENDVVDVTVPQSGPCDQLPQHCRHQGGDRHQCHNTTHASNQSTQWLADDDVAGNSHGFNRNDQDYHFEILLSH
ncbi:hypothetical protein MALGJ_22670 [Mycolicibacter algericus]|uniref:Uncharacterized protein n=1 Tax=Mycolicibacter algericus TaxID=1288388 RepID=A0A7I9YA47_MYCAL|nr:hypothetical protein MALGJ_22670 [Mycolicibacter algericus]